MVSYRWTFNEMNRKVLKSRSKLVVGLMQWFQTWSQNPRKILLGVHKLFIASEKAWTEFILLILLHNNFISWDTVLLTALSSSVYKHAGSVLWRDTVLCTDFLWNYINLLWYNGHNLQLVAESIVSISGTRLVNYSHVRHSQHPNWICPVSN